MKSYILTRIGLSIPMILIILTIVFFVLRVLPGNPVLAMLGPKAPPEVVKQMEHKMGLDKPILVQYVNYLKNIAQGKFGESTVTGMPVIKELMQKFPATLELTIFAMIVAVFIGIFYGTYAAYNLGNPIDVSARIYSIFVYSFPVFWFGLMLQLVFGVWLHWLPVSGEASPFMTPDKTYTGMYVIDAIINGQWDVLKDSINHLILPSITLGVVISSIFVRMVRANVVLTLSQQFVVAARARGVKEKTVLFRHALKNALPPILTIMGLQFALLLGGAVLTEVTFSWPGIGSYLVSRIHARDFPSIQGTIVFFAIFVAIISILVDVINAWINPRVRY
ncbi:ABC transporter permease [Hippea maritima]|uniref:ABC-type transporter, integral membrane subunit n=1 Tax=Hippea maritima (strain ATCC 700847 / DSM 10411 / MH2) TaxID=760142 RepID=F2LXA5_HIPMA|nr:ABC transporter permease [Hippea maritima]AEA34219.1 ABC-type transporter, integral membrane subunit [Hippea maritima DSM 10411]